MNQISFRAVKINAEDGFDPHTDIELNSLRFGASEVVNFGGGSNISPEFSALLFGLVLYTASFIAQIVRAGIQSISHGQTEAAVL